MYILELIKVIILGIVEGITEWLPISSTGHMILVDEFIKLNVRKEFLSMFLVVIQLGAILAVVIIFWAKIFPFSIKQNKFMISKPKMIMWSKILVACVPAAIVGILLDDLIDKYFYNYLVVALALIIFGILFIMIENRNKNVEPRIRTIRDISYKDAILIGIFQLIAAIFPGTSRSGATILGGILIGLSRTIAAEFTFFLAIPVMFGASLLKLLKFGFHFTGFEMVVLILGMAVSLLVSVFTIKFLMGYIKKNDFKVFGWYRIILGVLVILYFAIF